MTNVLITGHQGFIGRRIKGGQVFAGQIQNFTDVHKQTEEIEGIIHLAAKSSRSRCDKDPRQCIMTNLIGLSNILEVALERNIWVLFISTYQIKECHLYGLSKLMGEELCRLYKKRGVNVKIIRLPVVYGPGDRLDKMVAKFIEQCRRGEEPEINTDEKFHFLYVDDVARMIESEVDIIYNGFGQKYSLRELRDGIMECLKEIR